MKLKKKLKLNPFHKQYLMAILKTHYVEGLELCRLNGLTKEEA